jgi:hypothetical protein
MDAEASGRKMPENDRSAPQGPLRITWWKLGVGLILVLIEVKDWLTPNQAIPDALKYSNETQQSAGYFVSFAIFLLGLGLVVAGLRDLWIKRSR